MKIKLLIFFLLATGSSVWAQDGVKSQYIGLYSDIILIRGAMDGDSWFTTEDEIILVPRADAGFGAGIGYGFRWDQNIIDFAYFFTVQDYFTAEEGYAGRSSHHLVRYLGGKRFTDFSYGNFAEFYTDLDLAVIFSHYEKVSYGLYGSPEYNSANFSALTVGFGGGVMFKLSSRLAFDLRLMPELYIGTDVRAKDSRRYPVGRFLSFMLLSNAGIVYYL